MCVHVCVYVYMENKQPLVTQDLAELHLLQGPVKCKRELA